MKYRCSVPLVVYWQNGRLVFENYLLRTKLSAEPLTCSILHYCQEARTFPKICTFLGKFSESSVRNSLSQLCKSGLLESSDAPPDSRLQAMHAWASWSPAAACFHFSTRDAQFAPDPIAAFREMAKRAKHSPMPLPVKGYPKAQRTKLPHAQGDAEFPAILRARRSWRIYGSEPVPLEALAQTLDLTFGIQGWVDVPGLGRAAMKTSPSCGCLHPIEAYVLVQRVNGLRQGIYHYNASRHELEWLRNGIPKRALEESLGHQWWFARGAFLILMTAVFARTRWKYESPRVYRGILMEAGHLCQTFCLTATWLGLAPFCTIAHNETQWEKWLGIDGISESVLYVAGAGTRPPAGTPDAHMGLIGKNSASRSL